MRVSVRSLSLAVLAELLIATPAAGQQGIELDPAGGAERGEHVTMGQSTDDLNGVGGGKQLLAAQHGAQLLDLLGRPVGEVLEGSVLGLAILAITLAQQDGWR